MDPRWVGPATLLAAWVLHDVEEAIAFPSEGDRLADRTGIERLRITPRQSWIAVGLMGSLVAAACWSGVRSSGGSRLYRAVVAGLEAHVGSHVAASIVQRGYTAGVVTAVPVMLSGALVARRALARQGPALTAGDAARGIGVLLPAALVCHAIARQCGSGRQSRR